MTNNWMELRHASAFVVELDAIEASILFEAVQSHSRELARKRELIEASNEPGKHHLLAIIYADDRAMFEAARRIEEAMARAIALALSDREKTELFGLVKRGEKEAA